MPESNLPEQKQNARHNDLEGIQGGPAFEWLVPASPMQADERARWRMAYEVASRLLGVAECALSEIVGAKSDECFTAGEVAAQIAEYALAEIWGEKG